MDERKFKQHWNIKKILFYLIYLMIGKHLPDGLGPIGRLSKKIRRVLCRPLFLRCDGMFNIEKKVDFGNGSNIILRDHANIGPYATLDSGGRATITIGRHVMMGRECIILCQNQQQIRTYFLGLSFSVDCRPYQLLYFSVLLRWIFSAAYLIGTKGPDR